VIRVEHQFPFINRKKLTSQNVLAFVNFDMTFGFAHFGWEGPAHDARVLFDAKDKGLLLINNRFYLGDGGYPLLSGHLVHFPPIFRLLRF
jgi:hypothetical protein